MFPERGSGFGWDVGLDEMNINCCPRCRTTANKLNNIVFFLITIQDDWIIIVRLVLNCKIVISTAIWNGNNHTLISV